MPFPTWSEFKDPHNAVGGILTGIFTLIPATYYFLYATKVAKTSVYMAMTVLLPFLALGQEFAFAAFGVLPLGSLSTTDMIGGAIISLSGLYMIFKKYDIRMGDLFSMARRSLSRV